MSVKISLSVSEAEFHYCGAWDQKYSPRIVFKIYYSKAMAFQLTENFLSDIYQDAAVRPGFC